MMPFSKDLLYDWGLSRDTVLLGWFLVYAPGPERLWRMRISSPGPRKFPSITI